MRRPLVIVLSLMCVWGSLQAVQASQQGLTVEARVYPTDLYIPNQVINFANPEIFPTTATLTVKVRTAGQQPVADVPVHFQASRDCARIAALSATQAQTNDQGVAQAQLEVEQTTGLCHVLVQVGDMTREVRVTVLPAPETPRDRPLVPWRTHGR